MAEYCNAVASLQPGARVNAPAVYCCWVCRVLCTAAGAKRQSFVNEVRCMCRGLSLWYTIALFTHVFRSLQLLAYVRVMVHSHIRCAGMGWAALITQLVKASIEIHWVTSAAHPIPSQRSVCVNECTIGRVSYIRISLCYFCFRWTTVSLVQASMQYLMHHVTVSLQQSKITLQNNCINTVSYTHLTLPTILRV